MRAKRHLVEFRTWTDLMGCVVFQVQNIFPITHRSVIENKAHKVPEIHGIRVIFEKPGKKNSEMTTLDPLNFFIHTPLGKTCTPS